MIPVVAQTVAFALAYLFAPQRGVVTRLDDGRQRLEFRRSWPDPIEDGWSALTEPGAALLALTRTVNV